MRPTFRVAQEADAPHLLEILCLAEASGGPFIPYARLFDLSAAEVRATLLELLEVDALGCELCWPNYWVAEVEGQVAAGLAAWYEGAEGLPSAQLKGQLLAQALGRERLLAAKPRLALLGALDIPRVPGTLQLDAIAVLPTYRGHGLAAQLIGAVEAHHRALGYRGPVTIQLMAENAAALRCYTQLGYTEAERRTASAPEVPTYVPGTTRLALVKGL